MDLAPGIPKGQFRLHWDGVTKTTLLGEVLGPLDVLNVHKKFPELAKFEFQEADCGHLSMWSAGNLRLTLYLG